MPFLYLHWYVFYWMKTNPPLCTFNRLKTVSCFVACLIINTPATKTLILSTCFLGDSYLRFHTSGCGQLKEEGEKGKTRVCCFHFEWHFPQWLVQLVICRLPLLRRQSRIVVTISVAHSNERLHHKLASNVIAWIVVGCVPTSHSHNNRTWQKLLTENDALIGEHEWSEHYALSQIRFPCPNGAMAFARPVSVRQFICSLPVLSSIVLMACACVFAGHRVPLHRCPSLRSLPLPLPLGRCSRGTVRQSLPVAMAVLALSPASPPSA